MNNVNFVLTYSLKEIILLKNAVYNLREDLENSLPDLDKKNYLITQDIIKHSTVIFNQLSDLQSKTLR